MYDLIARYYDLTHTSLTADIPLVLALAQEVNGPVLELGCGTGRLLLPLARAGYETTGVDHSPAMLARLQQKLAKESPLVQSKVHVVPGDMANLPLPENGRFALALIPYNTLMHLPEEKLTRVLQGIGRFVRPGGCLFIDLANPFAVAQTPNDRMLTLEAVVTDPETQDTVLQMAGNWLDETAQQLHITWIYDATPAAGGPIHRTVAQTVYHYFYPHQIEIALQEAGFQLKALWGDYNKTAFDEESDRLLVVAVKS